MTKEGKARQLTEKYGRAAAISKEYCDAVKQMLDNVDQTALQLSRMIKVMDQPYIDVSLDRIERGKTDEETLRSLKKWGGDRESLLEKIDEDV